MEDSKSEIHHDNYKLREATVLEIQTERRRQLKIIGGPKHDDEQTGAIWLGMITRQVNRAFDHRDEIRTRLIKIAATAVAAAEAFDRDTSRIFAESGLKKKQESKEDGKSAESSESPKSEESAEQPGT